MKKVLFTILLMFLLTGCCFFGKCNTKNLEGKIKNNLGNVFEIKLISKSGTDEIFYTYKADNITFYAISKRECSNLCTIHNEISLLDSLYFFYKEEIFDLAKKYDLNIIQDKSSVEYDENSIWWIESLFTINVDINEPSRIHEFAKEVANLSNIKKIATLDYKSLDISDNFKISFYDNQERLTTVGLLKEASDNISSTYLN